jgi:predicted nuclease of predicted toxin-antitoxin system
MKFLANENFPFPSVALLRKAGYEVESIAEKHSGISDVAVIEIAQKDNRIILTFDKDYGEIIFRYKKDNPPAVIFFRFKGENPEFAGIFLLDLIRKASLTIENVFTVIERENIRQRKYN